MIDDIVLLDFRDAVVAECRMCVAHLATERNHDACASTSQAILDARLSEILLDLRCSL